jgi:hypothetical protein
MHFPPTSSLPLLYLSIIFGPNDRPAIYPRGRWTDRSIFPAEGLLGRGHSEEEEEEKKPPPATWCHSWHRPGRRRRSPEFV